MPTTSPSASDFLGRGDHSAGSGFEVELNCSIEAAPIHPGPPPFTIRTEPTTKGKLARLSGDLDLFTSPSLRGVVEHTLDEGVDELVVDLSGVTHLDAVGLGALVSGNQRWRHQGRELVLSGIPEQIMRTLEVTRLVQVFTIR